MTGSHDNDAVDDAVAELAHMQVVGANGGAEGGEGSEGGTGGGEGHAAIMLDWEANMNVAPSVPE